MSNWLSKTLPKKESKESKEEKKEKELPKEEESIKEETSEDSNESEEDKEYITEEESIKQIIKEIKKPKKRKPKVTVIKEKEDSLESPEIEKHGESNGQIKNLQNVFIKPFDSSIFDSFTKSQVDFTNMITKQFIDFQNELNQKLENKSKTQIDTKKEVNNIRDILDFDKIANGQKFLDFVIKKFKLENIGIESRRNKNVLPKELGNEVKNSLTQFFRFGQIHLGRMVSWFLEYLETIYNSDKK